MKKTYGSLMLVLVVAMVMACADHRETRTEIYNENVYLKKEFLTRANPGHTGDSDYGWLLGMTLTAVSVPTPIPDLFPGLQNGARYVRFSFTKDTMQIVDAITPGPYPKEGAESDFPDPLKAGDLAPRVQQEYEGSHVDIQLRKNLDGETTNFVEEYKERNWEDRQYFKADLEAGAFSDMNKLDWYYDWAVSEAMQLVSSALVPDSYHYVDTVAQESNMGAGDEVDWARGDYMEWTIRQTYKVNPMYSSLLNFRAGTDTQTMDIKYSLWRRPDPAQEDVYVTRPIKEKDKYRRQYGIWDYVIRNYQDTQTGLIGADMLLSRFNPNLPIDYYVLDCPDDYCAHPVYGNIYDGVETATNGVFEKAGVKTRIKFHLVDENGKTIAREGDSAPDNVTRRVGDLRYSFVSWHNNSFTDIPWLGYGPSWTDPRTGEIINAVLNFNNWQGLHYYTWIIKDLIEQTSEDGFDGATGSCTPGERVPVVTEAVKKQLQNTTMYSKLVSYMNEEQPEDWAVEHSEEWYDYYHMLMQDIRFFYPPYQTFVYSDRDGVRQGMQSRREGLIQKDARFWEIASNLEEPGGPMGVTNFLGENAVEDTLDFVRDAKQSMQDHYNLMMDRQLAAGIQGIDLVDGPSLLSTVADVSLKCKADGTWQTFQEWEDEIRWRIAHQTSVHELGHDLGLYHNFYGSMDAKNAQPCTGCIGDDHGASSSVMDYVHHFAEVGADLGWYPYDIATLIYGYRYNSQEDVDKETDPEIIKIMHPDWVDGTSDGQKDTSKSLLYANDYHVPLSPFAKQFDLGTTPTEIVMNHIQYYDWMYKVRNFRSYRQYWETWTYPNSAFSATFALRRFLDLWAIDWNGTDLENDLRLLGIEGDELKFANIRDEFAEEMGQANRLITNFYRAILTQSNAERSYSTTYDSYFGDVTRVGIIYDKFYSMLSFLGLWGADNYNWDVYALLAYYDGTWGSSQTYSDVLETVTTMLGGDYDVYPWFLPTAVAVFAQDTHDINFSDQTMKEWIGFRVFNREQDMADYFGFDPRTQCIRADGSVDTLCNTAALGSQDDGHQQFFDKNGGKWVYVFLWDRNQHVCASVDLSPISYKLIWDYNENVNINNLDYVDTYTIKYFIDYYTYFN